MSADGRIYLGGKYGGVHRLRHEGTECHHIIPKGCLMLAGIDPDTGPAIQMDRRDHVRTSSWGSSIRADQWRAKTVQLLLEGRVKEALQREVSDLESKFGDKYRAAVRGALVYSIFWLATLRMRGLIKGAPAVEQGERGPAMER